MRNLVGFSQGQKREGRIKILKIFGWLSGGDSKLLKLKYGPNWPGM